VLGMWFQETEGAKFWLQVLRLSDLLCVRPRRLVDGRGRR
jgi:transposase-like protein